MASTTPNTSQISNIPPPSSHRLPTVSVAQALHDLESSRTRCISSGLKDLDAALQGKELGSAGGVSRGKVTEIWGPPGVGKTALGMQLAASALHAGEGVVWVDTSHPISGSRFSKILNSFKPITPVLSPPESVNVPAIIENLKHFYTPNLAHLLALLSHHITNYEASKTSLIIIDSLSTLISTAFPRTLSNPNTSKPRGSNNSRKLPMLQHIVNLLQKLAASRNLAIVVLSQCVTKMLPGGRAVLVPAVGTTAWEQGLGCRVVLFRDWGWGDEKANRVIDVRLAEVVKSDGTVVAEGKRRLVGFTIDNTGLQPLALPTSRSHRETQASENAMDPALASALTVPRKRKLSAAELEIPDSEGEDDEDYGWAEEDEGDMPPMPPQWQGSEDILVPGEEDRESEGEGDEEEDGDGLETSDGGEMPSLDVGDAASGRGIGVEVRDSEEEDL